MLGAANLAGMDRAEAEAIYDAGREVCVQFILDLAARVEQLEERLGRLEAQVRQDSRTSSKPPSTDPPRTRAQRRVEARAKAKELLRREGEQRQAGQPGSPGIGVRVASCVPLIRSMRSSITTRGRAAGVATSSPSRSGGPGGGSVAVRSRSCRRSPWSGPSIARISCAVGTAWHGPAPGCQTRSAPACSGPGCKRRWSR